MPGVPDYQLDPEVVLIGLLPPLLYSTAIQTSLLDFRRLRNPIAVLSVGLVLFTRRRRPGRLAGDPRPAAGRRYRAGRRRGAAGRGRRQRVARRVGMPRKMVRLLEGESLFNDAAALVALRTSIVAIAGSISLWQVGLDFVARPRRRRGRARRRPRRLLRPAG